MITSLLAALLCTAPSVRAAEATVPAKPAAAARVRANRRLAERCRKPPFTLDDLATDADLREDLATVSEPEARALTDFAACRSLMGAPDGCASLAGLGRGLKHATQTCRDIEAEQRFVFLTLTGGDAFPACRTLQALQGNTGAPAERDCKTMIGLVRKEGARLSCDSLASANLITPQQSCESLLQLWADSSQGCARAGDPGAMHACIERATLVAGVRLPSRCASSPWCQALSAKAPGACGALRARFSGALCARVAKDTTSEDMRVALEKGRVAADAAAKTAQADALVRAKAADEAKKAAAAQAKIKRGEKPQFRKGEPMQKVPPYVAELMKAIEEGRPFPPKPKTKTEEEAPK